MAKNYYSILGVGRNATEQQIRERFKALARQRHPDRYLGAGKVQAELDFQEITEALNVLTNGERRRQHDLELARPEPSQQGVDARQLARVYLQRGAKAYREKNFLEAADNFDRATKADPEYALAWHNLALACSQQQRWLARATEAASRACELEPMNVGYLRTAGRVFEKAGMFTRAEQYLAEALRWGGADSSIQADLDRVRGPKKGRPGLFGRSDE